MQKEKPEVKPEPSYGRVLYNYFRDYDPSTGRYIESDPIGLGGGVNTYAYVLNNPVKWKDPYGESIGLVGVAAVGVGLYVGGVAISKWWQNIMENKDKDEFDPYTPPKCNLGTPKGPDWEKIILRVAQGAAAYWLITHGSELEGCETNCETD
jgi:RHS repeat-associated protein